MNLYFLCEIACAFLDMYGYLTESTKQNGVHIPTPPNVMELSPGSTCAPTPRECRYFVFSQAGGSDLEMVIGVSVYLLYRKRKKQTLKTLKKATCNSRKRTMLFWGYLNSNLIGIFRRSQHISETFGGWDLNFAFCRFEARANSWSAWRGFREGWFVTAYSWIGNTPPSIPCRDLDDS